MPTYYNEIDPYAAQWLRNLIQKQLITAGEVDERPIQDVRPVDLTQFTRCHFFAGIAGWDIALQQANYPTDKQVWTGSCPCQPFSTAGKKRGFADERHLWPYWFHLISVCKPDLVFGEQVADKDGLAWLDLVQADLEGAAYAVGTADIPAAGVEAPHKRSRLWFVAHPNGRHPSPEGIQRGGEQRQFEEDSGVGVLGDSRGNGREDGRIGRNWVVGTSGQEGYSTERPSCSSWSDCDWLPCTDGKARPVEPGSFPLAHGVQRRASKLRAYGNAIVPQVAIEFIKAYLACRP